MAKMSDIDGPVALQILTSWYFRRRIEDATEAELDEIRETIEIAKGWRHLDKPVNMR